ncbi:MAG: peptidase M48 [Gallionellales bacterium 35-53-114]|jgi:predicted Zn-dependent protease|nr:MAG: peptidase M48 [Gallionellales bacterium 35-53-114]OYZ64123.1 MAG: peptidase M48 [Gallionellales bacterium 24-53-125]HQS57193.1 M48 family metalloprotease [Gallionellaceae bacterium]HQS74619.1 M48 family metalloprotease [Gallionellaceae bacterium]
MKKLMFAVLCSTALFSHAEGLPDLGDVSQEVISPQQERQIGEQSMLQIRADKSYLNDAEVADYLNLLGGSLVLNSSEPGQPFEFFAINDNAINAFAMPGGFIGVNTGLILTSQSESELASVLSHEIAHVTQHHIARLIAGQKFDSLASMALIAAAILSARSNPDAAMASIAGVQAVGIQRQINFTRVHEQEADRIGLSILQKSGFDTRAMPTFFERLQKSSRLLEGNTPTYLRTHPVTNERVADVANRVQQLPYRPVASSLDFHLVRAKLHTLQKNPQQAIAYFNAALGKQKFGNPVAQRYGLVNALLKTRELELAAREFTPLRKHVQTNAMITTLAGQLRRAGAINDKDIVAFYRTATQNFPQHRALIYDYSEVLLQNKRYGDAVTLLNQQVALHPNDAHLYELQARTYAALGRHQEEHHAIAYYYLLNGNLRGAIEQLELAKKAGTNFQELSTIETELRQFREFAAAQEKNH